MSYNPIFLCLKTKVPDDKLFNFYLLVSSNNLYSLGSAFYLNKLKFDNILLAYTLHILSQALMKVSTMPESLLRIF
jgi:hypothetical protein